MGQLLHGSAKTTHAIRASIRRSQASVKELSEQSDLNPKTDRKWKKRDFVDDASMGPKEVRSTVLTPEEEAIIPHLTRTSLHRCLQRHGISRLPAMEGDKPKEKFRKYPIGYGHIDIADVRTEEGKLYLFVAIDRVCDEHEIEHRLTKINPPWTNGQVERMNRTIKDATVKRYHYENHDQLREHLRSVMIAYNFAKRLKTLKGLTPYEYICKIWTLEPERFKLDAIHHTPGLNT